MSAEKPILFDPGSIYTTPGARDIIGRQSPIEGLVMLARHIRGDWAEMGTEDQALNLLAVHEGSRIFGSYQCFDGTKIWVITEAKNDKGIRAYTTFLLPEEY